MNLCLGLFQSAFGITLTNLSLGIIPQSSTEDRYPDTLICYRVLWMSELVD